MRNPELLRTVRRVVSDVESFEAHLEDSSADDLVRHAVDLDERGRARCAIIGAPIGEVPPELRELDRAARERTLEGARSAMKKMRSDGVDADLAPEEQLGAEAIIVLFGRPAILVQDGRFFPPPNPWEVLDQSRPEIERTLGSVGRIEVTGHPRYSWVGTGFLVAEDVVMTNRHVAKEFSRPAPRGKWEFEPGMAARIDFAEELNTAAPREFPITEVIGLHDELDLALLRVEPGADGLPDPLPLASAGGDVAEGIKVYLVGYPAADPGRNDPQMMAQIFNNIYEVKRLQPGEVRAVEPPRKLMQHDCSTLGGNSGSCVVNLSTHEVIGLHFQGTYLESNWAVALWEVADDPLIKKGKIRFAGAA